MRARTLLVIPALAAAFAAAACTVEKKEEGEMPKVEGGKAPEYDVKPADVNVRQDTHTVVTPAVEVTPQSDGTKKP
jgi:hypothetical protein